MGLDHYLTPICVMAAWEEKIDHYTIKNLYDNDGIFPVVCSDYLYENIVDSNSVRTLMPWDKLKIPVQVGINQLSTYSNLLTPFEAIGITFDVHFYNVPVGTAAEYHYFTIQDDHKIRCGIRSYNNYTPSSVFCLGDTRYSISSNKLPIWSVTFSTSGSSSYLSGYILLCNNDKSLHKVVWCDLSGGNVTYGVFGAISDFNAKTYFESIKPAILPEPDPYSPGGHSGGGGGTGRFSRTGDTIGEHNVPTLSATDAGFITLFAPTAGEMKALASYLWSDLFSIETFKKIFANPMDAILGLSIVPVAVPTSGSAPVKVGNISTGVSMTKASTQYVKLSCGSLDVEEYWGAYLDYSPYTKCEIYLPYIGIHELSIDDVMGKTVKVVYYIDILSGACTAEIYSNSTCLYSFVGQCSASIPITGNDWTNVINGVMQIGASIGSMVASGGLTAPISAGGVASGLKSVTSASSTVTASKPSVERSGSMSGAGGMLGQQTPYLIITWPKECIPADQNKYIGYPSFVTVNLGEIVGFNIIESVHLENIPATSAELDEIESLLMNGVIF